MSFLAGSIIGTLGLETGGFTQGFLQAEALTSTFPGIVTNFLANPLLGFVSLAKTAMTEFVGIMTDAFSASLENADKLNDMATNVGVAVDVLSGLGLAASQAGSSTDAVADAFKFLGKNVAEAMEGNKESLSMFRKLGLDFQDALGNARPLGDLMFDLADALAGVESAGTRTQLAMGLLGRSGTDLLATLIQGSAALKDQIAVFDSYGAVVSGTAAKSADAFGDLLGEVKIAWQGIQNILGEPIREALTPVLQDALEWVRDNSQQIAAFVRSIADGIITAIKAVIGAVGLLKDAFSGVSSAVNGIGDLLNPLAGASFAPPVQYGGGQSSASRELRVFVNAPSFDARDASSQVANKLTPVIRQGYAQGQQAMEVAAQRALVESGL